MSKVQRKRNSADTKRTAVETVTSIVVILVLVVTLGVGFFQWQVAAAYLPSAHEIPLPQQITISDMHGERIGTLSSTESNRIIIKGSEIPHTIRDAIVAAEDKSFWGNKGYDVKGIARAALGHMKGDPNAGGGSTITQQYIKNSIGSDDYSLARKWNELVLSVKMSRQWSKHDVLTNYLNTVYFGRGAYGIEKAALAYFGKHAHSLNYYEAALLAGAVQRPSVFDPNINYEKTFNRWAYVMGNLVELGKVDIEEVTEKNFPKVIKHIPSKENRGPRAHVIRHITAELESEGWTRDRLARAGVTRITSTIDLKAQEAAETTAMSYQDNQPGLRTAVVSIDPKTGAVRAYYGGRNGVGYDYGSAGQMTGSSFKIFALAAALDQDIPLVGRTFSAGPYKTGNVTVKNASSGCNPCTMSQATLYSLNTVFYRIQDALQNGPKDTARMAYAAGVPQTMNSKPTLRESDGTIYPGIVLGQYLTSPFDMASAYSTFAARGMRAEPYFVSSIWKDKTKVYSHTTERTQRIRTNVADSVTYAMIPVAQYSYHPLAGGRPSASKTGTVQLGDTGRNRDAWMVGYTPSLSTAVWVGTDDGRPLTYQGADVWGATVPASIWSTVMSTALEGTQYEQFPNPEPIDGVSPVVTSTSKKKKKKSSTTKHTEKSDVGDYIRRGKKKVEDDIINPDVPREGESLLDYLFRQED